MMLQFANPVYLWLMLSAPLLLWWTLRRRRSALRHPGVNEFRGLPAGRARQARWGSAILRSLALLLLILAVAGPRWPDLHTRIETEGIAIMMLVDVSGSMAERDFDWRGEPITRLEAVKKAFHLFIAGGDGSETTGDGADASSFQGRPTDQIGLVTFATRPETACPLTLSHSVLLRLLQEERPRTIPGESETNISDAVAMGLHRLHSAGPLRKVLVLLSDGEHNVPHPQSGWTPRQAAHVANGLHVPIYSIDAGGLGVPPLSPPNRGGVRGGRQRKQKSTANMPPVPVKCASRQCEPWKKWRGFLTVSISRPATPRDCSVLAAPSTTWNAPSCGAFSIAAITKRIRGLPWRHSCCSAPP